jgi:hypothetical protein
MKEIIFKYLNDIKNLTSLSEGNYSYMIEAENEDLQEISEELEKEIKTYLESL